MRKRRTQTNGIHGCGFGDKIAELVPPPPLDDTWGETLRRTIVRKCAAGGLYGYTKKIQGACERASSRLSKFATKEITRAVSKDPRVLAFLQTHAKRSKNLPAKVLLAAYKSSIPKFGSTHTGASFGMYGFPSKTAKVGIALCADLRQTAGRIAAELHQKKTNDYDNIVGFFGQHGKVARCKASKLILMCYPDQGITFKRASGPQETPKTIDDWLQWEPT